MTSSNTGFSHSAVDAYVLPSSSTPTFLYFSETRKWVAKCYVWRPPSFMGIIWVYTAKWKMTHIPGFEKTRLKDIHNWHFLSEHNVPWKVTNWFKNSVNTYFNRNIGNALILLKVKLVSTFANWSLTHGHESKTEWVHIPTMDKWQTKFPGWENYWFSVKRLTIRDNHGVSVQTIGSKNKFWKLNWKPD